MGVSAEINIDLQVTTIYGGAIEVTDNEGKENSELIQGGYNSMKEVWIRAK